MYVHIELMASHFYSQSWKSTLINPSAAPTIYSFLLSILWLWRLRERIAKALILELPLWLSVRFLSSSLVVADQFRYMPSWIFLLAFLTLLVSFVAHFLSSSPFCVSWKKVLCIRWSRRMGIAFVGRSMIYTSFLYSRLRMSSLCCVPSLFKCNWFANRSAISAWVWFIGLSPPRILCFFWDQYDNTFGFGSWFGSEQVTIIKRKKTLGLVSI